MKTIFITSVGSICATGVVFCLKSVRSQIRIVGANTLASSPGNFLCDRTYLVPKTADKDTFRSAVKKIVEIEHVDLVIAGRDEELYVLGGLRDEGNGAGTHYLVPSAAHTSLFTDKYESARFARKHGLPFAETAFERDEANALVSRHGFPLIAKPRWLGFGSRDVRLIRNRGELDTVLASQKFVIQELLLTKRLSHSIEAWQDGPGIPWTWATQDTRHEADYVFGRDGAIISSCLMAGHIDGAINEDADIIDNNHMREIADGYAKILGSLGLQGPFNVQGKLLSDGRYVPFEINARYTGSVVARAFLGNNQVLAAVKHWLNLGEPASNSPQVMVRRFPVFLPYAKAWCEELAGTGKWTRPDGR